MFNAITQSQIYVLDQDEAIDFYVGKLGLEITADVDMGFMRWLTVGVPVAPSDRSFWRSRVRRRCRRRRRSRCASW
ncbi:hypothetical protein GCM10023238_36540 [Streptomyces heliomycini]